MRAWQFWHLIGEFNAALDTGQFDGITIEEVKKHIRSGTIGQFLVDRIGDSCDFSPIESADWSQISEEWHGLADAYDEKRKMGLENRGICLLIAYAQAGVRSRIQGDIWQSEETA